MDDIIVLTTQGNGNDDNDYDDDHYDNYDADGGDESIMIIIKSS